MTFEEPEQVTTSDLNAALDLVVDSLLPNAIALGEAKGKQLLPSLMATLRPLLKARVYPDGVVPKKDTPDGRSSIWELQISFSDVSRQYGEAIGETDIEEITGLTWVGVAIREYAQAMHPDQDFSTIPEFKQANMAKRMGGMYPAISKGGGSASTVVRYTLDDGTKIKLEAKISRA